MSERKPSVFISYSHKDEEWKRRLVQHLGVLADERGFDVWDDERIQGGADWKAEIERAILSADVAVLLVSVDFLTSRFIKGEEVPPLLRRRNERQLDVVPVIVRPCNWEQVSWLGRLQARPEGGRPLNRMREGAAEAALASIALEISRLLARSADCAARVEIPPNIQEPERPAPSTVPRGDAPSAPEPSRARQPERPAAPPPQQADALPAPAKLAPARPARQPVVAAVAGPPRPGPVVTTPTPATVSRRRPAVPSWLVWVLGLTALALGVYLWPRAQPSPSHLAGQGWPSPSVAPTTPPTSVPPTPAPASPTAELATPVLSASPSHLASHGKPSPSVASTTPPTSVPPTPAPASPTAALATPVLSASPSPIQLTAFAFETVKVDARGSVVERKRQSAQFYEEDLGDGVKLSMVAILGGTFVMGSPKGQAGRSDYEGPQRTVTVAPFFLGQFEVTQAQWRAVARWPQVARALVAAPSGFKGDDLPVENVSWDDAVEFCVRLSRRTGRRYRLPSEAEWEYAARAGTTTPFHFGEAITPALVNYNGTYPYAKAAKGECRQRTMPVGSFKVGSAFGLFDMHGNVWEWVADDWHGSYTGAPVDRRVWAEPARGSARVIRGGSWFSAARFVRAACRFWRAPVDRSDSVGFRCARVQE